MKRDGIGQDSIEGPELTLRPITDGDTDAVVRWRNAPHVRRNFIYREDFTTQGQKEWMDTMVRSGRVLQFIICEKPSSRPVGSVYFRLTEPGEAEYGVFIGEADALGKGYGSQTAGLAVEYARSVLKLTRLYLRVFTDNLPAIGSYERAGFARVKLLPDVECSDGSRKDMYLMELRGERSL